MIFHYESCQRIIIIIKRLKGSGLGVEHLGERQTDLGVEFVGKGFGVFVRDDPIELRRQAQLLADVDNGVDDGGARKAVGAVEHVADWNDVDTTDGELGLAWPARRFVLVQQHREIAAQFVQHEFGFSGHVFGGHVDEHVFHVQIRLVKPVRENTVDPVLYARGKTVTETLEVRVRHVFEDDVRLDRLPDRNSNVVVHGLGDIVSDVLESHGF